MTLHAEDFTLQGQMNQSQAMECVELMNRGIEEKDYRLYQEGITGLMGTVAKDNVRAQQGMHQKVFQMDAVARFVDEVQGIEMGLEKKPFQTRIGIGELFMNPTLEVLDAKTGNVIAVFKTIHSYRLADSIQPQIEIAQDGFIKHQKRRSEVERQITRTQAVMAEPGKMNEGNYDDLLVDPWEGKFGILRGLYLTILRKKHADYYATEEGLEVLQEEINLHEKELREIQVNLDVYVERISDIRKSEGQSQERQAVFVELMNGYQLSSVKTDRNIKQTA